MEFVVDASITLAWFVTDERDRTADAITRRLLEHGAVVPALWRWEVGNAFVSAQRKGRISADRVREALEELTVLPIRIDPLSVHATFGAEVELARRFTLSVYDAAYLELALRLPAPLATRDVALAKAAREMEIEIY